MGMRIDEAIKMLEEIIDEGWLISDLEKCPAIDSCELAIDIMRKYQKIQEIYEKWNGVNDFSYKNAMEKIGEVLKDGND